MTEDILDSLAAWMKRKISRENLCLTTGEDCGTTAIRMTMDTSKLITEIICWRSGDYVAEIFDSDIEKIIYWKHGVCCPENFASEFSEFLGILENNGI